MTENEWLACTDPERMLEFLKGKVSERKLRLFAAACCRRIWHLIQSKYHRRTVEMAERFADRKAVRIELWESYQRSIRRGTSEKGNFDPAGEGEGFDEMLVPWPSNVIISIAEYSAYDAADGASHACADLAAWTRPKGVREEERTAQAHLLRCIFGPSPFRSATLPPDWLTPCVVSVARKAYDEMDFIAMPILAYALEEGGCTDAELLGHLRGPGPHVRGCWVVDLLLGKG
jgi:hypothetical protein